ncbi:NTP transferase domain-containing protein, partial [Chromobacterium subtsugae]|uniref:NTP transferase domain-containing protein n=1 Tax=Chromobacterium subtsugae TaxID=251747 RepID=UPI0020A17E4F
MRNPLAITKLAGAEKPRRSQHAIITRTGRKIIPNDSIIAPCSAKIASPDGAVMTLARSAAQPEICRRRGKQSDIMKQTMEARRVSGLILAGGQGMRMGGQDKGWLELAGAPLIELTLARLRPQLANGELLISANR